MFSFLICYWFHIPVNKDYHNWRSVTIWWSHGYLFDTKWPKVRFFRVIVYCVALYVCCVLHPTTWTRYWSVITDCTWKAVTSEGMVRYPRSPAPGNTAWSTLMAALWKEISPSGGAYRFAHISAIPLANRCVSFSRFSTLLHFTWSGSQ